MLNSIWWSALLGDFQYDLKTARYLNNKGISTFADLWDGHLLGWSSPLQLKTMYNLKDSAMSLLAQVLGMLQRWPVSHIMNQTCFFKDWCWPVDMPFIKPDTKNVYQHLLHSSDSACWSHGNLVYHWSMLAFSGRYSMELYLQVLSWKL